MGLIVDGPVLPWDQGKGFAGHIKDHGIAQLLNIWKTSKDRRKAPFKWGEEVSVILACRFHAYRRGLKIRSE